MNLGKDTEDVVGCIIFHCNKMLLIKGSGGKWSFPKGRRREGETPLQGALREAKEEAGIDLSDRRPDMTLFLRYGTYYLFNLWRLPDLETPSTPEEVLEVAWHDMKSMEGKEKNADLKFYCKTNKPKKIEVVRA